jgi:ligand-binding sensor domain-containing protein
MGSPNKCKFLEIINKIGCQITGWLMIVFLSNICLCYGQEPSYYFDKYSLDKGFTCKSARDAVQDNAGFMYFTTENGLVRYNGHQFKYYRENKKDSLALQASYCVFMEKDMKDKIWIMAGAELEIFDPTNETFHLIKKNTKDGKIAVKPTSFHFDASRNWMWVATEDGLYVSKDNSYTLEPVFANGSIQDDGIREMYFYNEKMYCIHDDGLLIYNIASHQTDFIKIYGGGFSIFVENVQRVYVSTGYFGLILVNPMTKTVNKIPFSDPNLEHNAVESILKDKTENKLWVGTVQGLYTFDLDKRKYTSYIAKDINSNAGINSPICNFLFDNQNGLWICGHDGLYRLDFSKQFISQHKIPFLENRAGDDLPAEFYFEHHPRHKDSIAWIHLYYREMFRYDMVNKRQIPLPSKLAYYGKRKDIGIFNLKIDSKNRLWLMTNEEGLIVYDINKDVFVIPPKTMFIKTNKWAINIYEEDNGNILICTYDGLYKMNIDNSVTEWVELNKFLWKHDFHYIRMVDVDSQGNIYLARTSDADHITANIVKYNPKNHQIQTLSKKDCSTLDKLTQMEYMMVNEKNQVFVGSFNGLVILTTDLDCSKVRYFNSENGLANENVFHFEEGEEGRVWYNHHFGMTQYIPQYDYHQHITYFNSPINRADQINTVKSPNTGIFYTGIMEGFELLDINNIKEQQADRLTLTNFKIDNKPITYKGGNIVVSHDDFPIEIEVTLLQFTNSDKNTYYYTIDHGEKFTLQGNILKFNKLPAGTFTISLSGKNFYGREAKMNDIIIKVLPPFYQTWWFVTVCTLAFIMVVFYYYKLKDQHRQNLTKIRDNISKDLHDDLGSNLMHIKLVSELELIKKTEVDKNTFRIIAEEIKVVMDNMSDIVWLTQPQFDHLEDVMARIKKLTVDLLEKKDVKVIWHQDDLRAIKVDINTRKQFYLALKEIINNCGKYSNATTVQVEIKVSAKEIFVMVRDNGNGFDPNAVTSGNGLRNIKTRVEDCRGRLNVNASLGQGVQYEIYIPLLTIKH